MAKFKKKMQTRVRRVMSAMCVGVEWGGVGRRVAVLIKMLRLPSKECDIWTKR